MNLPQIRLQSTYAKLEMQTNNAQLTIQQPPAELSIEQPSAEMDIQRTPSRLTIDQTKAREDVDLKSTPRRIEEAADRGKQDWLDGIARRAQDGDELMLIENGGTPFAEQAKRNSETPEYDFNIGWIPSAGSVKIDFNPSKVDINWKINKPIIHNMINQPRINYIPGNVDVHMKQYQSLKIDFDNLKYVGINYEQSI